MSPPKGVTRGGPPLPLALSLVRQLTTVAVRPTFPHIQNVHVQNRIDCQVWKSEPAQTTPNHPTGGDGEKGRIAV